MNEAAIEKAEANQVDQAVEDTKQLPDQPDDCRRKERSNVTISDRLDVALVRTDQALSRANDRIERCAEWYADVKESRQSDSTP